MAYDIDFNEKALIKDHIRKFLLFPVFWEDTGNHYNYLLEWKSVKFLKSNKRRLPNSKGVYCFVVKPKIPKFFETKYLFYIGQTTRYFPQRFQEYLSDQEGRGKPRPKVYEMLTKYKKYLYFYYTEIANNMHINDVETKLLDTFAPQINTKIPKAKIKDELKNIYE